MVPPWRWPRCPTSGLSWTMLLPQFHLKKYFLVFQIMVRTGPCPSSREQPGPSLFPISVLLSWAVQYQIAIQYDETAQSPYFHYTDHAGVVHEVWFEDARSMDAKLRLIAEYGFKGAGFWNLMRPFSQTWLVLDSLYDISES